MRANLVVYRPVVVLLGLHVRLVRQSYSCHMTPYNSTLCSYIVLLYNSHSKLVTKVVWFIVVTVSLPDCWLFVTSVRVSLCKLNMYNGCDICVCTSACTVVSCEYMSTWIVSHLLRFMRRSHCMLALVQVYIALRLAGHCFAWQEIGWRCIE